MEYFIAHYWTWNKEVSRTEGQTGSQSDSAVLVYMFVLIQEPIPVASRSKAWVCGLPLAGGVVRVPWVYGCLSLLNVVYCQVEVSASGWSPFQRSPTKCGVAVIWSLDNKALAHWGFYAMGKNYYRMMNYCVKPLRSLANEVLVYF
jgi:ABC-type Co2+ transport system permease subunit